jgi:hypothetical protein
MLIAALAVALTLTKGQAEQVRRITDPPSSPIPQLLRPGDLVVTLDPGLLQPMEAEIPSSMPAAALLREHAEDADRVVVGKVVGRRPHLTVNERWIVTSVQIEVREQLKTRSREAAGAIEIQENGGTVVIDGVTVTAVVPWEQRFVPGDTYLLFVQEYDGRGRVKWSYRVNSDRRLESTFTPFLNGEAFDTAHGLTLEQARGILRSGG